MEPLVHFESCPSLKGLCTGVPSFLKPAFRNSKMGFPSQTAAPICSSVALRALRFCAILCWSALIMLTGSWGREPSQVERDLAKRRASLRGALPKLPLLSAKAYCLSALGDSGWSSFQTLIRRFPRIMTAQRLVRRASVLWLTSRRKRARQLRQPGTSCRSCIRPQRRLQT